MSVSAIDPPAPRTRWWPWIVGLALFAFTLTVALILMFDGRGVTNGTSSIDSGYIPGGATLQAPSDAELQAQVAHQQQVFAEVGADLDRRAAELDREIAAQGGLTSFGSGTHLVGVDIQPGTYSSDSPYCYWARLSDTTGSPDSIIANGISEGPTTVTILPGDNAFETNGCYWSQR